MQIGSRAELLVSDGAQLRLQSGDIRRRNRYRDPVAGHFHFVQWNDQRRSGSVERLAVIFEKFQEWLVDSRFFAQPRIAEYVKAGPELDGRWDASARKHTAVERFQVKSGFSPQTHVPPI